jgi:hypothetical protein
MAAKNQKRTGKKPTGKFRIELSFYKALSLGAFVVLAMIWSFILGVFVGRGYNPEDVIPDIARIIPDSGQEMKAPGVLRLEDLDFFDRLRSTPAVQRPSAPVREKQAALTQPEPAIRVQPDPPSASAPVPAAETFIYSYQVGSFQTMDRAIDFQKRLGSEGFSASIADAFINNEPWYRVIVEFESSEQGSARFMDKLESHGIKQPLLRGKRPS